MKKFLPLLLLAFICAFFIVPATFGADAKTIKKNMMERLSKIDALKAKGLIGENNKGYLQAIKTLPESDLAVVNAENADRKSVYTAIAKQQNTTADLVGNRRALQIAEKTQKGEYTMDKNGNWKQK